MTLLPNHFETFVLTESDEKIMDKLNQVTTSKILTQNQEASQFKFTGWAQKNRFRISIKINRPNNYIPLIIGRVDRTSSGCLVFVTYRLFPSTKMFLVFWSLFLVLAGVYSGYQYQSILYPSISLFILAIVHWIAWSNFKIQLKITHQILLEVLTSY